MLDLDGGEAKTYLVEGLLKLFTSCLEILVCCILGIIPRQGVLPGCTHVAGDSPMAIHLPSLTTQPRALSIN